MPLRVFLARACNSHFAPYNGPFRLIMRRLVGDHACENAKAHVCVPVALPLALTIRALRIREALLFVFIHQAQKCHHFPALNCPSNVLKKKMFPQMIVFGK